MPKANWCKDCSNAYERVRYEVRYGLGNRVIRQPKRPLNLTIAEAAYLAGLIDGEGSVGFYLNRFGEKKAPTFSIYIANTHPGMEKWIARVVQTGSHKLQIRTGNQKNCHMVFWHSASAIAILKAVFPYLVLKKTQARWLIGLWAMEERYLKYHNRCRFSRHYPVPADIEFQRDTVYQELRNLNRRGVAA